MLNEKMKILAIGNSFSVDALHYFSQIAASAGIPVETFNLYIGGCSLQQHADNLSSDAPNYICFINGCESDRKASIRETLQEKTWDIVTIQQASHDSGMPETYEPYGTELIRCVKEIAPDAKIWFHKTWAYEHGSDHSLFPRYDCNQQKMYEAISSATEAFVHRHGLPVIPSGDVIQTLRSLPEFDFLHGGISLCRDSFHMSMTFGRYAVAATWFEMLLDGDIRKNTFAPAETEPALMDKVRCTVHDLCRSISRNE